MILVADVSKSLFVGPQKIATYEFVRVSSTVPIIS